MSIDEMNAAMSFDEFWRHYQEVHASRSVRIAHAIGTTSALALLGAALVRRSILLAVAAPVVDYAIAQGSHTAENLTTHPYKRPLWHARAELKLFGSTIRSVLAGRGGRTDSEPAG